MNEQEGVIKYRLDYSYAPPVYPDSIREINAWRGILFLLGLIGQDPARYGGLGYGNVSQRLQPSDNMFVISGTQTAHLAALGPEHYAIVKLCDPIKNYIQAQGPIKPSSEALTHGAIYRADPSIQYVFHVHSTVIWQHAVNLDIPITAQSATYGTPEMAKQIQEMLNTGIARKKNIIAMGGHEDGIVSFGETAEQAGQVLVSYFSRALQRQSR